MTSPLWIAQRHGQDWEDPDCLAAIAWLTQGLPSRAWSNRMEAVQATFEAAKVRWAQGERVSLFDPADAAAWYVFQARAYAADREHWFEPEAYRIVPLFRRIGQLLPQLKPVKGAEDRVVEMMTRYRRQPDDGLYELLVAGAYRTAGWTDVACVPAEPGVRRRPDLFVSRGRRSWAAECKRVGRSGYGETERARGEEISQAFHAFCRGRDVSLSIQVAFKDELAAVGASYLADRAEVFLQNPRRDSWDDASGAGWIRVVDRRRLDLVLQQDDLFFGSSRMIQLIEGAYSPSVQYSLDGSWRPAKDRPFHAAQVGRVSAVSWLSASEKAQSRKAKHFRKLIREAADQLPGDRPGVVHVGYEAFYDDATEALRHALNHQHIRELDVSSSRLRYVYANYMAPEHTNDRNESSALTETTATYPVGNRSTAEPLKHHLLFADAEPSPGPFWARRR
jgi:hypothetical protein